MIALIQRVQRASVSVNQEVVGEIDAGLLVLLGVERTMTTRVRNVSQNAYWAIASLVMSRAK